MVEKSGELKNIDKLDPVSTAAGAGMDDFLEKYEDEYPDNSEQLEATADTDNTPEETEHIKAQIDETRSNMGETIDAIQDRLSFSNISEQVSEQVNNAIETAKDSVYDVLETAKESAYEATLGKVVNYMKNASNELSRLSIVAAARENPFPFILIGLGAGLLAYNSFGKKQSRSFGRYRTDYRADDRTGYRVDDGIDYNTRTDPSYSRSTASNEPIRSSTQEKLNDARGSLSNAAESAYEGVANVASTTYSEAGKVANKAFEKVGDTYSQYLDEKPWAIGAVALVAGAAVGLAIPSTRYEGELMGEARYNLMSKAQDTASNLVDKAKQVATEAGRTITEETKAVTKER